MSFVSLEMEEGRALAEHLAEDKRGGKEVDSEKVTNEECASWKGYCVLWRAGLGPTKKPDPNT